MSTFLPKDVAAGLRAAQRKALKKKNRLRVQAGDHTIKVVEFWDGGFSVEFEQAPQLRGLVDLYDGSNHLYQALIVAAEHQGDEMHYEFKRNTSPVDQAPLDYAKRSDAPVALIGRS